MNRMFVSQLFNFIIAAVFIGFQVKGEIVAEPTVALRWDFTDCGKVGRFGPSKEDCSEAYKDQNLETGLEFDKGIQIWTVPITGLYLVTAAAPAGLGSNRRGYGKGAVLTAEFHMTKGQKMRVLVGQQTDYPDTAATERGVGGSGGTFIVRESDGFILLVAGGGSGGAGIKWDDGFGTSDASLDTNGHNASTVDGDFAYGGTNGSGAGGGIMLETSLSSSGGGAGFYSDGITAKLPRDNEFYTDLPRKSISFISEGSSEKAPGVGGSFQFTPNGADIIENNGGFGGGGGGSFDGGAGGGGGYSGGGGGPPNGWGGGGGSFNSGERQRNEVTNRGKGYVTISFIGHQCCGPVVVYVAMSFVAGVLVTILLIFVVWRIMKAVNNYDGEAGKTLKVKLNKIIRKKEDKRSNSNTYNRR